LPRSHRGNGGDGGNGLTRSNGATETHGDRQASQTMHLLRTITVALAMLAATAAQGAGHQLSITPPPLPVSLSPDQARILAGIRADDRRAIVEAGWSRDRIYWEALSGALRRQRPKPDDWTDLQQALARLGDSEQLQKAWCLSINERNPSGYVAPGASAAGSRYRYTTIS
jgi:hypothetical protein